MGKRKKAAKKPQTKKKNEPLPTTFPCLFCNHEKSVVVKLDKKAGVGQLACKVCDQKFQCAVNYLSAGVDVYSEWVDACDAVAKEDGQEAGGHYASTRTAATGSNRMREEYDDDVDVDDDNLGGGAGYSGEGIVGDDEEY